MTATTPTGAIRPRRIEVEEFFADPEFSGASISPGGNRIAYLAPKYGRTQVWVRGIEETHDEAVCVTRDERRGIKTYYWTDDPRWLLYRQDTDGNEDWHIYRVDLDAPEDPAVDLTPMAPGSRVVGADLMRTKPGHLLVGMNPDPMVFGLYTVEIATGETTLVRESPADSLAGTVFGRETEERFFSKQAENGDHEFYAIDESGERRLILRLNGPEYPIGPYPMFPSADGDALIIGMHQDGIDETRLVRVDHSGEQTELAALPGRNLCTMGWASEDFGLPRNRVPEQSHRRRDRGPVRGRPAPHRADRPALR
ncbi:Peptidase S9 prolyl oligopeptidase active site domain protein OS=Tsukamurella paurometabola (strain ATCC 8368 / DSM / CCUG 35730 / CIP 100753 / JCM 10117/ KCTC 9821 / NBRC 16120 / NCIMB 702349 / NCTC 13040) OX=521096 GN=Tpau_1353 PE=4 SV=1 [Tsukamurella paurometabola]|nr:hypothetical protein [Tsukamurella paurometabola]SUP30054.1 Uncharacterised protein [Tsukamurella paurometabola]